MSLESDLFKRKQPVFDRLEEYGFQPHDHEYVYHCSLPTDRMQAEIHISNEGKISGKVVDPLTGEEYVAVHTNTPKGTYAARIRSEYLDVLTDVDAACFREVPFVSTQMNRMGIYIKNKWNLEPSHPFKRDREACVYDHAGSKKWFALIQEIDYGKLDSQRSGQIEILTLKKGKHFKKDEPGVYPAWHMNHDQWLSIVMDDSLADQRVQELVDDSYEETLEKTSKGRTEGHWIIPANPSYFDLDHAFRQAKIIYWKQSTHIVPGDLVFIYYGSPYSQLRYLCKAVETNIPYEDAYEGPVHIQQMMRIQKLYYFDNSLLNRKVLAEYGVKYIRGPLHIPSELEEKIIALYPETAAMIKEGEQDE